MRSSRIPAKLAWHSGAHVPCLTAWGTEGRRRALAELASHELQRANHYPSALFVPQDPFALIAWDYLASNVDHLYLDSAIQGIERHLHTSLSASIWQAFSTESFGQVIDALLAAPIEPGA